MKSGKASVYLAGDIAKDVPQISATEIAALIRSLAEVLRDCRHVNNNAKEAALWLNSLGEKDGRRRRTLNEMGRLWRGRITFYDKLETTFLARCLVVTEAEMAGLFAELIAR